VDIPRSICCTAQQDLSFLSDQMGRSGLPRCAARPVAALSCNFIIAPIPRGIADGQAGLEKDPAVSLGASNYALAKDIL
jgi:hypothetical protein